MTVRAALLTPPGVPGAVTVVEVRAGAAELDPVLERLHAGGVGVGQTRLRRVWGVDDALVARVSPEAALLMPHGGSVIVRLLLAALTDAGVEVIPHAPDEDGRGTIEDRLSDTLARAASPLAIDLLLDQPRRWLAHREGERLADGRVLGRLIDPPTVAAVGAPNIGKSSLLNALAGRSVALAFDLAGTTRDAVGALIDLGGLMVRWVDTPGMDPGDQAAIGRARAEAGRADLVLWCADARAPRTACDIEHPCVVRAVLRSDTGDAVVAPGTIPTSARTGAGLTQLVRVLRDTLAPPGVLEDSAPWRFWQSG